MPGIWQKLFGPADREEFARQLMEAMRRAGISDPIQFHAEDLKLTFGCAGGKVAKGACLCGKGFKPVKVSQDAFRCAKAPAPTRSTGKADSKKTDGKKIDSKPVRSSGGSALTRGVR